MDHDETDDFEPVPSCLTPGCGGMALARAGGYCWSCSPVELVDLAAAPCRVCGKKDRSSGAVIDGRRYCLACSRPEVLAEVHPESRDEPAAITTNPALGALTAHGAPTCGGIECQEAWRDLGPCPHEKPAAPAWSTAWSTAPDRLFDTGGPTATERAHRARANRDAQGALFTFLPDEAAPSPDCPACGGSPTACTCASTGAQPLALL